MTLEFAAMESAARGTALTSAQIRTNARLESFGDIVFGFTLVLMASRLRVPEKPEELIAELPELTNALARASFGERLERRSWGSLS